MNTKFTKIISLTAALALSVGLFTGCGKTDTKQAQSKTAVVTKEPLKMETVRIWTGKAPWKDLLENQIKDYNNTVGKEKGINIELTILGADATDKIRLALTSGQAPELYHPQAARDQFFKAGWALAIEDFEGGKDYLKRYEGKLVPNTNTVNGKTISVPFEVVTTKMVYNKDLFAKAGLKDMPKTWSDVKEYAKKITSIGGGKQFGYGSYFKEPAMIKWEDAVMFAPSVGHAGFNFKLGKYAFSDFKPVLDILAAMRNDDKSFLPGDISMTNDNLRAQFSEGNVGIRTAANWDAAVYTNQFPTKMDWGVFDVPVLDATKRFKEYNQATEFIWVGPAAKNLSSKTFEVFKFFNSDELLTANYEAGNSAPTLPEIIKNAKKQPTLKYFKELSDVTKGFNSILPPDGSIKVEGASYQDTISKIILGGSKDVAKELEELDKRYNSALDKAVVEGFDKSTFVNANWDTTLK